MKCRRVFLGWSPTVDGELAVRVDQQLLDVLFFRLLQRHARRLVRTQERVAKEMHFTKIECLI